MTTGNCFAQILGDPIFHFEFEDGIPSSWENASESEIGVWEYRGPSTDPDNTVCSRGSCGASSLPITSLTAENGFVIFDSNYWDDDDDICGGLGTGQDPAPHSAWLTTQPMNFSSYSTLVLTWQQQYKHYISTTKVQISNDGGLNYVDIFTNPGVFSPTSEWRTVNISTWAANQADVRIRFYFSGTYYWWLLDDIVVYSPNPNDVMLTYPKYTTFNPQAELPYHNMEYNMYPTVMIPQFNFSGTGTNIGGNVQTQVKLIVKVKQNGSTQVYSAQSTSQTMNAGQALNFSLSTPFTSPASIAEYEIQYDLDQLQTDDNVTNNKDTVNYFITPFTYARDENAMEDKFVPAAIYSDQLMELGNIFEGRSNTPVCHSIAVAIAEGTTVGTQVSGVIYKPDLNQVIAITDPYTVNAADLNSEGGNFTVVLPLITPMPIQTDSLYAVMISKLEAEDDLFLARSGPAYPEIGIVAYPESNALYYMLKYPMVRMNIFSQSAIPGCTDPLAMNYTASANTDDGSCRYPGCTDPNASNYDPDANWYDGTCILSGCTDPQADNYNPYATTDDGSCIYYGCTDPQADNYDPEANQEDGTCIYLGCMDPDAINFDIFATVDDGSCLYAGCTDPSAANYDPDADVDDGSCQYPGCTNPDAINYDPGANVDDGSCIVLGCTDPAADNYDPGANTDDGSCYYLGCMDPEADNYDPTATIDDGSCLYFGCTDPGANNYDPDANADDFSCLYNTAALALDTTEGCVPLLVTIYNQTDIAEDGNCFISISDGFELNECISSFQHEFSLPGEYFVTYTYQQGTSTTQVVAGPIVVHDVPEIPIIQFEQNDLELICSNCGSDNLDWFYNDLLLEEMENDSFSVFQNNLVQNGYYQLTSINEFGCTSESDSILVLVSGLSAEIISGCVPLTVEFTNGSVLLDQQVCNLDFGDENFTMDCTSQWTHDYLLPGTFNAVLTIEFDGVEVQSEALTIDVFPYPAVPLLSFDPSLDIIACTGCDGYNSVWLYNGEFLEENQNAVGWIGDGLYQVVIANEWGCSTASEETAVINDGQPTRSKAGLKISPAPCDDSFVITFQAVAAEGSVLIRDLSGKIYLEKKIDGSSQIVVDSTQWPSAVYVVTMQNGVNVFHSKMVVQH